jgi:uncharacterized protein (TIGR02722 family)
LYIAVVALFAFSAMGCSKRQVTRVGTDTTIDLSGRWNDADSRMVSDEMIHDCLSSPWKNRHVDSSGKRPAVIVGIIRNKTSEHITVDTFIGDMERSFINTGDVTVVASAEEREQLREERADQQTYSSDESVKKWGRELGADYMLSGTISSIADEEGGEKVIFYQVDLTLIDLENNVKVWLGQKKIKKYIGKNKVSL